MKILVVGLGGVGGYYGGLLAKRYENDPEIEIGFLARGKHLQVIKENGLTVITETGTIVAKPAFATDNIDGAEKMDYVILATKSYDLEHTIDQIRPCIKNDTVILPLLNGGDISERIRRLLPGIEVWDGCVYIVGRLNSPGVVESSGGVHDLYFGAEKGSQDKLLWMDNLLKSAGLEAHLEQNIKAIIWKKFIFISVTASLTSYFNVGFRDLLTDEKRKEVTMSFMNEIINVAKSENVEFGFDVAASTIRRIESLPFGTTSSMHSDFKAGRNAEVETLTKVVIELGSKNGIETPIYQQVYRKLKEKLM